MIKLPSAASDREKLSYPDSPYKSPGGVSRRSAKSQRQTRSFSPYFPTAVSCRKPSYILYDESQKDGTRERPDIVIFGFPPKQKDEVKKILMNNYEVSEDCFIGKDLNQAYVVVRPESQKIALALKSLDGTLMEVADSHVFFYFGVFETRDYLQPSSSSMPAVQDDQSSYPELSSDQPEDNESEQSSLGSTLEARSTSSSAGQGSSASSSSSLSRGVLFVVPSLLFFFL